MPRAITYNCDVCGAQRKEANHWFAAAISPIGMTIYTWASAVQDGRLDRNFIRYLCGQSCAHKLLDQFLQSPSETE
jgi:hypothetical protein